jgi:iron only hydrogenase large subunit-like protein
MNFLNPIYTEKRECQDCYKCVRNCPVKAIKVESGYASVIPELCVLCGQCVEVCPSHAKKVRDDLPRARQLLATRQRVMVSLAPSFVSEFPEWRPGQIIRALKQLGFAEVSETALGAQQVSARAAEALRGGNDPVLYSSACPTVVAYLQRHRPGDSRFITGLLSPLLTHCKLLRGHFGEDIAIVFIGPCIAKKLEAEEHPELLDVALTFEDLRRWLEAENVKPEALEETASDVFVPERSAEGAWYPVDGGMIAGMKANCTVNDCSFMSFSGLGAIEKAIDGLGNYRPSGGLFLELLACEGGCVNGPRSARRNGTVEKRCRVLNYGHQPTTPIPRAPSIDIRSAFAVTPPAELRYPDAQVREALRLVGKFTREDELNCGGCGYDSCREFATALINQKAERNMCVTYMRKLAHKKANALIQKMPSAVVIVNDAMRVIEFNQAFASMFAKYAVRDDQASVPMTEGVMLSEVMPYATLFHSVLKSGQDIVDRDLRYQNTILHASIFTIEKHCVVGGILQDITEPAVRKEQVIKKAQEVIQRSLATTQEIARLLGENAAESEITLNSIIDSFTPPKPEEEPKKDHDWRKLYRR